MKQYTVVVCIVKNPNKEEHHDERSNSLSEQFVLVLWRNSLYQRISSQIVGCDIHDHCDVNAIVSVGIDFVWRGGDKLQYSSYKPGNCPQTNSQPGKQSKSSSLYCRFHRRLGSLRFNRRFGAQSFSSLHFHFTNETSKDLHSHSLDIFLGFR